MKSALIIIFLITLAGCVPNQATSQERLMDEIESSIALPAEALPLRSYARYYTQYQGSVLGAYTTQVEEPRPADYGCEELRSDGSSKAVGCRAIANVPLGQRRWVEFDDYPAVSGRGCTALQLDFDPGTKGFNYLECAEADY
ncbi:hypothetical protein [Croceibacterium mercuriale]|uniref:hypothetical protein n=1 Tax=Croceibacterium mercuriale TaxID=1572751 RepID=UPI00126A4A34|nr:hypothetical protein [Croceibacterium mercuriale]